MPSTTNSATRSSTTNALTEPSCSALCREATGSPDRSIRVDGRGGRGSHGCRPRDTGPRQIGQPDLAHHGYLDVAPGDEATGIGHDVGVRTKMRPVELAR